MIEQDGGGRQAALSPHANITRAAYCCELILDSLEWYPGLAWFKHYCAALGATLIASGRQRYCCTCLPAVGGSRSVVGSERV